MASSQHDRQHDRMTEEFAGSWRLFQLPDELLTRVLAQLPPNDIACNVRLVCKEVSAQLKGLQHITVSVGDKPARVRSKDSAELVVPARALWGQPGAGSGLTFDRRRQLLCQAARTGNIPVLDQLSRSLGCLVPESVLDAAASAGQLDLCKWLLQQHPDPHHLITHDHLRNRSVVCEAVCSGNTDLVGALLDIGFKLTVQDLHHAVEKGNRAMCEWLTSHGCPWAADTGRLSERLPAAAAAHKGDLQLLAWALSHGKDDGSVHVPHGAQGKLLSSVAHGCPLSTLQQLYQQLCPALLDADGVVNLTDANDILTCAACSPTPDWRDKVLWLAGQAPQLPLEAPGLADNLAACKEDAVERVGWLRERGLLLTEPDVGEELALFAAGEGNLQLLEYLMDEGLPDLPEGREAGAGVGLGGDAQGYESDEEGEEGAWDGEEEEGDGQGPGGWEWQPPLGVQETDESGDEGEEEEDEEAGGGAGAGDEAGVGQAAAVGAGGEEGTGGEGGQVTAAAAAQAAGDLAGQAAEGEEEDEEEGEEASESEGYAVDDWERLLEWGVPGLVLVALDGCHLHVLKALHARGVSMAMCSMVQAARQGDLPLVQWLMEVQGRLPAATGGGGGQGSLQGCVGAGLGGGGDQQGQAAGAADGATGSGGQGLGEQQAQDEQQRRLQVLLRLLNRRRQRLTSKVMDEALVSKNEGLVRWLRGVGCPWSSDALEQLAWWGSEELLQWAVEEGGCPMPVSGRAEAW